jgi:hypothetical protein
MDSGMTFAIQFISVKVQGTLRSLHLCSNDDGVIPAPACESADPEGLYKDWVPVFPEMTNGNDQR